VPALPVVENASSLGHSRYHLTPAEYWSRNGECANHTRHAHVTRRDATRCDVTSDIRHQTSGKPHLSWMRIVLNCTDRAWACCRER
jgi:hypothetical protein